MRRLIPLLQEIQIMRQGLLPALLRPHRRQRNLHIELAPSLLADVEGRVLEHLLLPLAKGVVEQVGGFFVAGGGQLFAVGADEVDVDVPVAEGEGAGFGGLGAAAR